PLDLVLDPLRAIDYAHLVIRLVQPHPPGVPTHQAAGLLAVAAGDRHQAMFRRVVVERDDLELLEGPVGPGLGFGQGPPLFATTATPGLDPLAARALLLVGDVRHHDAVAAQVDA